MAAKEKLKSASNQKQILYDNKPNHTHTRRGRPTLYILKLGGEGEPVET